MARAVKATKSKSKSKAKPKAKTAARATKSRKPAAKKKAAAKKPAAAKKRAVKKLAPKKRVAKAIAKVKSAVRKVVTKAKKRVSIAKAAKLGKGQVVATGSDASRLIDQRINDLGNWRSATLSRMRALIHEADPQVTEEWKWANPVWSHNGILCTGEAYAKAVKLTFPKGASLPDPTGIFNSSLAGGTRRAIDIPEGATIDADAFKALVQAAVIANGGT